ncbi:MAG: hypothetical protein IKO75_00265 [Bacteroidales bacterium]|nr:hypothetical protein [Bacteroidales bacterium]
MKSSTNPTAASGWCNGSSKTVEQIGFFVRTAPAQPAKTHGSDQQMHHSVWPPSPTGNNLHFRHPQH